MEGRININVSAIDYDKSSKEIKSTLTLLEQMVHVKDGFMVTDSEFAFGWHFFVVSVNTEMIEKLVDQCLCPHPLPRTTRQHPWRLC